MEAASIQGAMGVRIGTVLMNLSNLGVGLVIAFVYSWTVTLVILAFVPFLIIGGYLQTQLFTGYASKDKEILDEAGKVVITLKETYFTPLY